jgi:DNA-binding Xre family transcriptional regulator
MPVTKLRLRILEDGRPQYEIAAVVGCSPARLSEMAIGKRAIPPRFVYGLVQTFKCNVNDVIGFEEDELIAGVE